MAILIIQGGEIVGFSKTAGRGDAERRREQSRRRERKGYEVHRFYESDFPEGEGSPNDLPLTVVAADESEAYEVAGRTVEKNVAKRKQHGKTFPAHEREKLENVVDVKQDLHVKRR